MLFRKSMLHTQKGVGSLRTLNDKTMRLGVQSRFVFYGCSFGKTIHERVKWADQETIVLVRLGTQNDSAKTESGQVG
ncbi:MAG: hypothetical protein D6714_01990 [Bacteroidetes bacterium]|nr:MAG: hypothetical protein D6714_01990 [Bacteroidota bacterium]